MRLAALKSTLRKSTSVLKPGWGALVAVVKVIAKRVPQKSNTYLAGRPIFV